jgi:2-oxoglutarate ferredoxin oxidoreductase subunit gamma
MERECLCTGIGGQGVQLMAQVLARAATLEGRKVMLFGVYAGSMRGGNTDATIVVGDTDLLAPPMISHTWSAIGMHDEFWAPLAPKLRRNALVLVNDATFETELDDTKLRVHRVPATDIAAALGNELGSSMVMGAAYAGITGIVSADSLVEAMRESIPSYRTQHIANNEIAIRAGFEHVATAGLTLAAPAWTEESVPA